MTTTDASLGDAAPGANRVDVNLSGRTRIDLIPQIGRRILRVVRTEDVTPLYRRVVFTSDSFDEGFPIRHFAVSDHVKLFFPHPQTGVLVFPQITENGWQYPEGAGEPFFRDYTVRDYDADVRELAIDFVLHDHGVAGRWAGRARPGDEIGQLGPRGHVIFPSDYSRYLAAGDATALPAIARLLEEAPDGSRVTAVIEVESAAEQQRLDVATGVDADIVWVSRDEAVIADGHLSALETAVRDVAISPGERLFVFVAGEAGMLKPIRRYLRRELGLPKDQVDVDGYWKRGVVNLDHHADADDSDD